MQALNKQPLTQNQAQTHLILFIQKIRATVTAFSLYLPLTKLTLKRLILALNKLLYILTGTV